MSTPLPSPASADLTRQQLDELDALLQRMLELPVHQGEANSIVAESTMSTSLSVLEAEPDHVPPLRLGRSDLSAPDYAPPEEFTPPARPTPERRMLITEPTPEEHFETLAVWWTPLVWGNQWFDDCAARIGKPGRWLRRSSGRAILGWLGVLFLAGAAALLIWDWIRTTW